MLRSDADVPVARWAQFVGRTALRQAWTAIVYSVQTGGVASEFGRDPRPLPCVIEASPA